MILSVVDAEQLYLSAKAFTVVTLSELEAAWHKPALERLEKMMLAMAKEQGAQHPVKTMEDENYGVYNR